MRYNYLAFLALLIIVLVACNQKNSAESHNGKLNVVATTGQLTDAVRTIAGDNVNLVGLLGPGIDPHSHQATTRELEALTNADIIFYNGLHLEAQMVEFLSQMPNVKTIAVGEKLPQDQLLTWSSYSYDPHIWNDPLLWSKAVEVVRDGLIEADPAHADSYRKNSDAYLAQIKELDLFVKSTLATIPAENRVIVTAHDAFSYYGRAYQLEVVGLQGISTQSEASTADVQKVANLIVQRKIPAIFVETSVSPRTVEAVKQAVQAQNYSITIGGSLYSDALGEKGTPGETYLGMIRENTLTIAKALGGTLPNP